MKSGTVLHIISSSGFYGAERAIVNLIHELDEIKCSVLCLTPVLNSSHQAFIDHLYAEGAIVYQTDVHNPSLFYLIKRCVTLIKQKQLEIIHAHGYKETVVGMVASIITKKPLIVTQHGFAERHMKSKVYNFIQKSVCRFYPVQKIICVSAQIQKIYLNFGVSEKKLVVIPNAVSTKWAVTPYKKVCFTPKDGYQDAFVVAFIGRLSYEKGPDKFIELINYLQNTTTRSVQPFIGVIIGDGAMRGQLEQQVDALNLSDKVVFIGFCKDVNTLLASVDVLALTSRTEGIPITLLEAMASGVPVVATNVGGVPEVIANPSIGYVVAENDMNAMAEHIITLQQNAAVRQSKIQAALKHIKLYHNIAQQAVQIRAIYNCAVR